MQLPVSPRRVRARFGRVLTLALSLCASLLIQACAGKPVAVQRYDLKGKVISVDRAKEEVTIDHEAVPGFMDAMVMPFTLHDPEALKVAQTGDRIQATLVIGSDGSAWLENPVITKGLPGGVEPSDVAPGPKAGDAVPDFSLTNQDGKRVSLRDYKGRAVLITFIYTRCPMPDQCPLMSTKFAEINRGLKESEKDARLRGKIHLLSVTVDPAHDTPKVLKSYGAGHTGEFAGEKFETWEFLTGSPEEVKRVAEFFGLEYFPEKDQIIHSLRTAVITPDGRVHKVYRGNEWKPEEARRELESFFPVGN